MGNHIAESTFPPVRSKIGNRCLPHNYNAEIAVLGGILIRPEVLALLSEVEVDDFYDMRNKIVFGAIRQLEAKRQPIDVVTLENLIEQQGKLDAIGGCAYLGECALIIPTVENTASYAALVVEYHRRRQVILKASEVIEDAFVGDSDAEDLIHDVNTAMMNIRGGPEIRVVPMGELAHEEGERLLTDLRAREAGHVVFTGIPTGVMPIDERIGGHPIGVMTIYAARPAMGKTTAAMVFSAAAKRKADMDSLLCSVEDRDQSFGQRALAQESGISTERIRARKVTSDDVDIITRGMAHARKTRGELFADCSGMEAEEIVRLGRRENMRRKMRGEAPLRQISIDYLQKVRWPRWAKNPEQAVGHISDTLSTWASTDKLAVVAFVQLNREVEKREDHMPQLSDLRDSGRLEQDGKLIFAIHHPWTYDPDNFPEHLWQLLVLKNANGRSRFTIDLYWDRETHSIYDSELDYNQARIARRYQ